MFQSPNEFRRFVVWLEEQCKMGLCLEIENKECVAWRTKRKFVCNASNEVWILHPPDPGYFSGSWGPDNEE